MPPTLIIYRERQAVPGEFGRGRPECPGRIGHPQGDCHLKQRLRHSNKTMIYCGRLQRPMPVLSAKKVLDVLQHASGPFSPAALASAFSLDLVTTLVLLECLDVNQRVPSDWRQYLGGGRFCQFLLWLLAISD